MKIITIAGTKGGIGKSVSAISIAQKLSESSRVLLVDMDPQNSATCHYIEDYEAIEGRNMYDVLLGEKSASDCIINVDNNIDLLPSDFVLEEIIVYQKADIYKLYDEIQSLADAGKEYDYIVIDTQPSRQILTRTAVLPADLLILPVQLDRWGLRGWNLCYGMITEVMKDRRRVDPVDPAITMLATFHQKVISAKKEYLAGLRRQYPDIMLDTVITQKAEIGNTFSIPSARLDKSSDSYKEYQAVTAEILDRLKKREESNG
jgi:cellulose biosynthesis protein BcsQ